MLYLPNHSISGCFCRTGNRRWFLSSTKIAKIGEDCIPPPDFFETALRNAAGRSFSGLRLAFRAAPRPLRNCSCRRRKPGMSGRRESPRTAFRARRKSGRRPIPIIYIGEIIRPLFSQSGSGAVFVVVRAVSATPYRKTISPQTAQLSLLLLFLSVAHGARLRIKSIQ